MNDLGLSCALGVLRADAGLWAGVLEAPMRSSGITTPSRIAMFLGQVAEESGGLRVLSEDLCYSTAERIWLVFGRAHFADEAEADGFVGRPEALGNRVYAQRMGNGDEASGDGWRYRGRGLIQITGRAMYERFAAVEPRAACADWLMTPVGAAVSACWFWSVFSLNALADAWDIEAVTRRINGGLEGLAARVSACEAVRAAVGSDAGQEDV